MNTTLTLMDLAGAVALLIWGVHMVQTGITRAYGPSSGARWALRYATGLKPPCCTMTALPSCSVQSSSSSIIRRIRGKASAT